MKTTTFAKLKRTSHAVVVTGLCLISLPANGHTPFRWWCRCDDVVPVAHVIPYLPGYVRTPFTDPPKLVDVRGMAPGSKAWCPYSHRLFIVPVTSRKQPQVISYATVVRERKPPPLPVAQVIHVPSAERPYGIAIPGRPGFVISPHGSGRQMVDVTGLAAGTEVRCPYTGKLFRVPPPQ